MERLKKIAFIEWAEESYKNGGSGKSVTSFKIYVFQNIPIKA